MMIYRPRKQDYKTSVAASSTITSFNQLTALVNDAFNTTGLPVEICDIGEQADPESRYIVCVKLPKYDRAQAVGYLNDSSKNLSDFTYKTRAETDRSISYYE